jgi:DNA-binding CsgD family transcriptional regulator
MNQLDERVAKLKRLTAREIDVLRLRIQGLTQKQIAAKLFIVERTVTFHLGNIYEKLNIDPSGTDSQVKRLLELQKFADVLEVLEETSSQPDPSIGDAEDPEPQLPSSTALVLVFEDEMELTKQESTALIPSVIRIPSDKGGTTPHTRSRRRFIALSVITGILMIGIVMGIGAMSLFSTLRSNSFTDIPPIEQPLPTRFPTAEAVVEQPTPVSSVMTPTLAAEVVQPTTLCGETEATEYTVNPQFLRHQGVSTFSLEGSNGAILNNSVRTVALDSRGLWIGYKPSEQNETSGVGLYTRKNWVICQGGEQNSGLVFNDIEIDSTGKVWIATDGAGVYMFDGNEWYTYTMEQGLPNNAVFGLTLDSKGAIWAATLAGIATLESDTWKVPYSAVNGSLIANKTHAIAFDSQANIWVGQIESGVSYYNNANAGWTYYSAEPGGLGGNQIRDIVVRKANADIPESIWFATVDGGVSKYEQGKWTVYQIEDGLPSNTVTGIALDKYNRVWVATEAGVAYLEGNQWILYNTLNTQNIAFGPTCQGCPIDDEHVWTGTLERGLTHSRLPHLNNSTAVKVEKVCFELILEKEEWCTPVEETGVGQTRLVSATLQTPVEPGTKIRFKITVVPRAPYQLRQDRGDFLSNTDADDSNLFSAWPTIPVEGTIEPGQPFMFAEYDLPIVAPESGLNGCGF